jgi:hypothetical protein
MGLCVLKDFMILHNFAGNTSENERSNAVFYEVLCNNISLKARFYRADTNFSLFIDNLIKFAVCPIKWSFQR